MFLSIVIPTYNEQLIIKSNISEIYNFFSNKFDFEIIIVNDGSTDNTSNIVKTIDLNNLKLINLDKNYGKGKAIKMGVKAAKGKYILLTDADLSAPINEYEKLFNQFIQDVKIVIGSRSTKGAKIKYKQPLSRIFSGKIFNFIVTKYLGLNYKDTQCGFKLFEGKTIKDILKNCTINRFCIDVEILFIAKKLNIKVTEIGIKWSNFYPSSVKIFSDSLNMFFNILKIKYNNYNIKK